MTTALHRLAAVLIASLAAAAQAFPLYPDPTGLWFIPSEPGWGMSITQQGETMFIVLYAHDANRQPTWYVASNVRDTGTHLDPIGSQVYAGTLYRATAPAFGAAFLPGAMTVGTVGTVDLFNLGGKLNVRYVINGVSTSKLVERQTWSTDRTTAQGSYAGNASFTGFSGPGCPSDPGIPFSSFSIATIEGERVRWTFGQGVIALGLAGCEAEGIWAQRGHLAELNAPLRCGYTSAPTLGTIALSQVTVSRDGLTAILTVDRAACRYSGRLAGVRTDF